MLEIGWVKTEGGENTGMTQKEESVSLGKNIDDWGNIIFETLQQRYSSKRNRQDETWFLNGSGSFHLVGFIAPLYGFIIEYANGQTEKDMIMAEDGDQYPLLDYDTPEEMLQAMYKEIERNKSN